MASDVLINVQSLLCKVHGVESVDVVVFFWLGFGCADSAHLMQHPASKLSDVLGSTLAAVSASHH